MHMKVKRVAGLCKVKKIVHFLERDLFYISFLIYPYKIIGWCNRVADVVLQTVPQPSVWHKILCLQTIPTVNTVTALHAPEAEK